MKISAYILLGDPRWLRESVRSYYPWVDRIVAIGDHESRAWDGSDLPVEECLTILNEIDREGKIEVLLNDLVRPRVPRMLLDTEARRAALAHLQDSDWVLQIDTDEILTEPGTFMSLLEKADKQSHVAAFDYPSRWFLGRAKTPWPGLWLLESSDALHRIRAHYPGPLAVRPTAHLNYSRRATCNYFRVDLAPRNTYHEYTWSHPVHAVVRPREAVMHLSWVERSGTDNKQPAQHGHAGEHLLDEDQRLRAFRLRHPLVTIMTNPARATHGHPHRLRLTRIVMASDGTPQYASGMVRR